MVQHPALTDDRVAVVTGAASGIGLAAAKRFASMGLRICLADLGGDALERATTEVASVAKRGSSDVRAVATGPLSPIVVALTTLGEVVQIALSFRTAALDREQCTSEAYARQVRLVESRCGEVGERDGVTCSW